MVEWTPDHMKFFVPSFEPSVYFHIENWRKQIPRGIPQNVIEALKSWRPKYVPKERTYTKRKRGPRSTEFWNPAFAKRTPTPEQIAKEIAEVKDAKTEN